jgi:hypothetical protein
MEMMHYEAGVRVVVVGGRPSTGPMQAPSGSRGARVYSTDILDANIGFVQQLLASQNSPDVNFLPNRTLALDVFVTFASINLRDQIRRDETVPLQFAYEAADCRIFYTPQTIYNYTALWQYAADAIWSKPSLCVQGSTGFATTGTNKTDFVGPPSGTPGTFSNITTHLTALNTSSIPYLTHLNDGLLDQGFKPRNSLKNTIKRCNSNAECFSGFSCASVTTCLGGGQTGPVKQCVPICFAALAPCSNGGKCQLQEAVGGSVGSQQLQQGICPPALVLQKCGVQFTTGLVNVGPAPPAKMR